MAVKAGRLLEEARHYPDLPSALADCRYTIGTTRRFGKYREDFLSPSQAPQRIIPAASEGKVALVFGREDRGLHTSELDHCQAFLTIPTREELPSMNLAQAVSLCLYELAKASGAVEQEVPAAFQGAEAHEVEGLFDHMRRTLLDIDFLDAQNPDHILRGLRRIFGRSGLAPREVRILHGLFSRVDWVEGERRRLQQGTEKESPIPPDEKGEG